LRRSLDDDVDCVVGQLSVKDFEQPGGCLEFLLFRHRVEQNRKVVVVVIRNGDTPEGEVLGERVDFQSSTDEHLEIINGVCWCRLDREDIRLGFAINETEQGQGIVVHGVVKHGRKASEGIKWGCNKGRRSRMYRRRGRKKKKEKRMKDGVGLKGKVGRMKRRENGGKGEEGMEMVAKRKGQ